MVTIEFIGGLLTFKMKLPCNECLKYPICRHKSLIHCQLLFDYVWNTYPPLTGKWRPHFPNLRTLDPEDPKFEVKL